MITPKKIYFINRKTKLVGSEDILDIKRTPIAGTLKQRVEIVFPFIKSMKSKDCDLYLDEQEWLDNIKKL